MAGSVYFQHVEGTQCRDKRHRSCAGKWRGELGLGVKASATYTVERAVAIALARWAFVMSTSLVTTGSVCS